MKKQAPIFDYARICKQSTKCSQCLLRKFCADQRDMFSNDIDKANEIILNWCEEHPTKTRQSEFLKMYPNAVLDDDKVISICPENIDIENGINCGKQSCDTCRKNYWLAEASE